MIHRTNHLHNWFRRRLVVLLAAAIVLAPIEAWARGTRIEMPKNKYNIEDDVQLGQQEAAKAERQLPLLRDQEIEDYVNEIGQKLVEAIPGEFQQPKFHYTFKVVNAAEINAFALPGGPMFVNRGMIEAAKTEGEMAGVMGHEISHVILRHATAQATEGEKFQIGSVLGQIAGGVIGGGLGDLIGMGSQIGFGAGVLRYGRKYETQSDILGAQLMAKVGYNPRDLANMFRTIEEQGGRGGPEWLSSHPNPGKRNERIAEEARLLGFTSTRSSDSSKFRRVQERLRMMPAAPKQSQGGGSTGAQTEGQYPGRVPPPSPTYRQAGANRFSLIVPDNWREFRGQNSVAWAPEGAYGQKGLSHGLIVGAEPTNSSDLRQASEQYLENLLQGNPHLRQQTGFQRSSLGDRRGLATLLAGRSPIHGRTELVTVLTTFLGPGEILYLAAVVPEEERREYEAVFQRARSSLRLGN
jgi:hypothetical protein